MNTIVQKIEIVIIIAMQINKIPKEALKLIIIIY